ncbi:ankyrin repeat-containing domain protein [Aspergillus udagawae]|uniref:Ankyrin repeat-containing domain protein n=1 Tax=Aspergillus udagawae TaxID=91492 RepID=A0A8H3S2E0_9EURO|nr:ankyrin repeat-containing domain protein [Aspergillus udagawae]
MDNYTSSRGREDENERSRKSSPPKSNDKSAASHAFTPKPIYRGNRSTEGMLKASPKDYEEDGVLRRGRSQGSLRDARDLVAACLSGNKDQIKSLLDSGSNTEIVKLLLEAGADVNQQLTQGKYGSALAAAASKSNTEIVKLLLEAGADVNQQLTQGRYGSALAAAATAWRNSETVKPLLEAGADVNQQLTCGDYGSALAAAAYWQNLNVVKLLLGAGADVNQQLTCGDYGNALATAAYNKREEVITLLQNAGANTGSLSTLGHDPKTGSLEPQTINFSWELPSIIKDLQEVETFLSNTGTLTRQRDTVELATSSDFLRRTYGILGTSLLHGVARALKSPQSLYGQCDNQQSYKPALTYLSS